MAKDNNVIMYGYIEKIKKKKYESGQIGEILLQFRTIRNTNLFIRYDSHFVLIQDKTLIQKFFHEKIAIGDMLFLKGILRTVEEEDLPSTVIAPFWFKKMETGLSPMQADKVLQENMQISNTISIFGTVCKKPSYYESETKKQCTFQIAANRQRPIPGDDKRTDYPWIVVFGKKAEECERMLMVGSEVYITGVVQTRTLTNGKVVSEVIPYGINYIKNCMNYEEDMDLVKAQKQIQSKQKELEQKALENNKIQTLSRVLCTSILGKDDPSKDLFQMLSDALLKTKEKEKENESISYSDQRNLSW